MKNKSKIAIGITLGCRLNQADTALIYGRLEKTGYVIAQPNDAVDPTVIIINTCTVTSNAARKSRQVARQYKKKFPNACLIVTGCDCEKSLDAWNKEKSVDFAIPNSEKRNISELIERWQNDNEDSMVSENIISNKSLIFHENVIADFPFKSRAFLKIQEGCNSFCTYCIVPHVRGRERSRSFDEVISEAKEFIDRGHKEIIITGVNISTYCDGDNKIVDILESITSLPGDFRLRLSSMEPHVENKNLVDLISNNKKICRFLHIPLQSGCDHILEKMGRKGSSAEFADFAKYALNHIPGLHLGTDIIVGFPGESDALFYETVDFIQTIPFANIHIFRFSPREGTPAATFKHQVPHHIVKKRAGILADIAQKSKDAFIKSQIGKTVPVLIEKQINNDHFQGWSDNYIKINLLDEELKVGEITKSKISNSNILSF